MAVRGIGIDLVCVSEFAEQLTHPGTTMLQNFTVGERRYCSSVADDPARHYAARWAAKEALIKAWSGSRFARPPVMSNVRFSEIEVLTDNWGRPSLVVKGDIAGYIGDATIHVSLTHDGDMAGAFVIIEDP
ncbi:holo-ACP synthase AcpS [Hoyosella subflava]|nr:holo-ACP synthase [Hoyosella subflava]